MSATVLAARFRDGTLRPSQALDAILAHASEQELKLNSFAFLDSDGARVAATESDARFLAGSPLGNFDGIPISVKDNICVRDMRCAWGSRLFADYVPEVDELPVARLRAQGAVLLGKTNVSEFTLGRGTVVTEMFGTTRNPWNPALTTGASTGGGAAAVAAGLGPVSLGTDGGGSIRRPAGYQGLVGLKPSTGRVPRCDGLPIILNDFEVVGPLARTVDDVAMMLNVIEGPDPRDRRSYGFSHGVMIENPGALRILYVPQFGDWPVDPAISQSCDAAAQRFVQLGFAVEQGTTPFDLPLFEQHWPVIGGAGLAWMLRDHDWAGRIGEFYTGVVERGEQATAIDYVAALDAARQLQLQLAHQFEAYDLIMTPSSGSMPWPVAESAPSHHRPFTGFANAAGVPAICLPAAPGEADVPIGFQLIAPFGRDWLLLSVARIYEHAFPWADRWP